MSKPHIVQCLCGPARHCITALAYEAGGYAPMAGLSGPQILTEENAVQVLTEAVNAAIHGGMLNPWCAICRAKRKQWVFEDTPLQFDSLAEAAPYLRRLEQEQRLAREFFEGSRN